MLEQGEVFAGYTVERLLGQGGMGAVYLARHPRTGKQTALKLLSPELFTDQQVRARFEREADLVAQLDHPGIIAVYDRGSENGQLWISMQYIDGVDAASVNALTLPPERAVQIIEGVAEALDYAHGRGVLHRDVKPANILLARAGKGKGERVFLSDFGIARLREDTTHLTQTGMFTATLAYASPEQMTGAPLGNRSDQYSLACALYWLLTGIGPFDADNPADIIHGHLNLAAVPVTRRRPGLNPALDLVLAAGMAKLPELRYRSCAEFAAAARAALTAAGPPPLPAPVYPQAPVVQPHPGYPPVAAPPVAPGPRVVQYQVPPPPVQASPVAPQPRVAQPPVAQPPGVQSPVAQPAVVQPPGAQPSVVEPPGARILGAQSPVAQPPGVRPPAGQPPSVQPPAAQAQVPAGPGRPLPGQPVPPGQAEPPVGQAGLSVAPGQPQQHGQSGQPGHAPPPVAHPAVPAVPGQQQPAHSPQAGVAQPQPAVAQASVPMTSGQQPAAPGSSSDDPEGGSDAATVRHAEVSKQGAAPDQRDAAPDQQGAAPEAERAVSGGEAMGRKASEPPVVSLVKEAPSGSAQDDAGRAATADAAAGSGEASRERDETGRAGSGAGEQSPDRDMHRAGAANTAPPPGGYGPPPHQAYPANSAEPPRRSFGAALLVAPLILGIVAVIALAVGVFVVVQLRTDSGSTATPDAEAAAPTTSPSRGVTSDPFIMSRKAFPRLLPQGSDLEGPGYGDTTCYAHRPEDTLRIGEPVLGAGPWLVAWECSASAGSERSMDYVILQYDSPSVVAEVVDDLPSGIESVGRKDGELVTQRVWVKPAVGQALRHTANLAVAFPADSPRGAFLLYATHTGASRHPLAPLPSADEQLAAWWEDAPV